MLVLLTAATACAEEAVDRAAPAIFRERLQALLTPIDDVLKLAPPPTRNGDSGYILLNERVVSVAPDGKRTIVRHAAYKALTESGAKTNADDTLEYRKKEQKIYLIVAETIQADGSRQKVNPDAVLLQSPQRQAQYSLYDDMAEMKIIFPNVKPGSVTHFIVVIEDTMSRIPGEFSASVGWDSTWATTLFRHRLEMPAEMVGRLRIETIGAGIPPVVRENLPGNRIAQTWTLGGIAGSVDEVSPQPSLQIGPVINFSTMPGWDQVAAWYQTLTAGRNEIDAKLEAQVKSWTAKARSPAETIAVLHAKVADQVRYVGLEFGASDYQPHNCNDVWRNQYGDCKDKANLLVAMLRNRGIAASIALVNTEHLGWIDRRTPSYRVFDHAIVAIRQEKGGVLFCDPTMAFSTPGMLGPGSADRDVLVVDGAKAEWVRTPPVSGARQAYDFELKLAASGEISGWLNVKSEGCYSAWERERYEGLDPANIRSELTNTVRGFYPGAEVVDAAISTEPERGRFWTKAYFVVPGNSSGPGIPPVTFPRSSNLFVDVGDHRERATNYHLFTDTITVSAKIALPDGLNVAERPDSFRLDDDAMSSRAQWIMDKGTCRAELVLEARKSTVKPAEFPAFYQGAQALQAWLARPLVLTGDAKLAAAATEADEVDLPMMATGDGQVDLVDRRYPESGDPHLRELALKRALQYFPSDPSAAYRAGVRLALLDWNADRNAAAHERLAGLLQTYRGRIKPEVFSWGQYYDALALRDLHKYEEAEATLTQIANDAQLSDERRVDAATAAADFLLDRAPDRALALLRKVAKLRDGETGAMVARVVRLHLRARRTTDARQVLAALCQSHPDNREELLKEVLDSAAGWRKPNDDGLPREVAEIVAALVPSPGEALRASLASVAALAAETALVADLQLKLKSPPLSDWFKPQPGDAGTTVEAFGKQLDAASKKGDASEALRVALRELAARGQETGFPERLWQAANQAEWAERADAIGPQVGDTLLELCDRLPSTEPYFLEGRIVRARRLEQHSRWSEEIKVLQAVLATPGLSPTFLCAVSKRLGRVLEQNGHVATALEVYRGAESTATTYGAGADCVLHAALLCLDRGDDAEAIRRLHLLDHASDSLYSLCESGTQLRELVRIAGEEGGPAYWNAARKCWPAWSAITAALAVPDADRTAAVPLIPALNDLGASLRNAANAGDAREFFRRVTHLVSAARWQPSLAAEVAAITSIAPRLLGSQGRNYQRLAVSFLVIPPPDTDGIASRDVLLAATYVDLDRPEDGLRIAAAFSARNVHDDRLAPVMHRIRAMAALKVGREVEAAAPDLERDLSGNVAQRVISVGLLSDIYVHLGRRDAVEQLLKREIASARASGNRDDVDKLQARLEARAGAQTEHDRIDAWIRARDLAWFDLVEPKDLGDPRFRNLEQALATGGPGLSGIAMIKLNLLAARDGNLASAEHRTAIRTAVRELIGRAATAAQANRLASSVIDDNKFDEETRLDALWAVLVRFAEAERWTDYQTWRKRPECEHLNESFQQKLAILDLQANPGPGTRDALAAAGNNLVAHELTEVGIDTLRIIIGAQLARGESAEIEKLLAGADAWSVVAGNPTDPAALKIEFTRLVRAQKEIERICAAWEHVIRARFAPLPDRLPPEYADLLRLAQLPALGREATYQAGLYLIKTGRYDRGMSFWQSFFHNLPSEVVTPELAAEICRTGLAASDDDHGKVAAFYALGSGFDLDEADVRKALEAELAKYRKPDEFPATFKFIRWYEEERDLRLGKNSDPENALGDLDDADSNLRAKCNALVGFVQRGDRAAARRVLEALTPAVLTNPEYGRIIIPALALAGMKDELAAARKAAQRKATIELLDSWDSWDEQRLNLPLGLVATLEDGSLLPPAWLDAVSRGPASPRVQLFAQMLKAYLDADWKTAAEKGTTLAQLWPTAYDLYWYIGVAEQHLGRREDATRALTLFVERAHDSLHHSEAVGILKALGPMPEHR